MGFSVQQSNIISITGTATEGGLAYKLVEALSGVGGMQLVFPATLSKDASVFVLDSAPSMDPLATSEPWRLRIAAAAEGSDGSVQTLRIHAGTETQIPSNGTTPSVEYSASNTVRTSGNFIGKATSKLNNIEEPFLNTDMLYNDSEFASGPLSFLLSVSDHGIAFCVWKDGYDDAGDKFAWFVVQRPVDPATGNTLIDGYAPVFALYSSGGGGGGGDSIDPTGIKKFVVRQSNVFAPTKSVSAVVASEDSNAIMNPMRQVAISVDNKYMITFPAGLNTPKRAYKHELDMIAYTSADVVSQDSDVEITVFGEAAPRKYKALNANGPYNTGMRILMLVQGGGVSAT